MVSQPVKLPNNTHCGILQCNCERTMLDRLTSPIEILLETIQSVAVKMFLKYSY